MLQWTMIDPLNGPDLGFVMLDNGPDYPYGAYVFNPGFGQDDETAPLPEMTNSQLVSALYKRNKVAFWLGGGAVGALALASVFNFIRR